MTDKYLAHYGVKGQKWGVRNWQNEDGTYTEQGKHHYGWGYYRPKGGPILRESKPSVHAKIHVAENQGPPRYAKTIQPAEQRSPTKEEIEARKARTRRIIIASAALTIAAIAAYKGSTKLRDKARLADVNRRLRENQSNFISTDWGKSTRAAYQQKLINDQRIRSAGSNITRRQAVMDFLKKRRWR